MTRCLPLVLAAIACPAFAASHADPASIERAAFDFAGAPVLPLDPRLRLASCPQPLALSWHGSAHDTVLVQCPASAGWRLYVSVVVTRAKPTEMAIQRGDAVAISIGGVGFAVSQPGEALEPGATGTWIRVRTAGARGETLRARVLRPGAVGIDLP